MDILQNLLISFIATSCFGIVFNVPIKTIPWCGMVGSIGWTTNYLLIKNGLNAVHASLVGAFIVAIVAYIFARQFRMPMIIFSVSGVIPLVPGGMAYNAMRSMLENDYVAGVEGIVRALMTSGALAMGLVFAEVLMQLLFRSFTKGRTSIESFIKNKKATKAK